MHADEHDWLSRRGWLLLAIIAGSWLAGCGGVQYARRLDDPSAHTSKVIVMDHGLHGSVAAAVMDIGRNEDGTLAGTVDMRNDDDEPLTVAYQVKFKDRAERIAEESAWTTLMLAPQKVETLAIASRGTNVQDFVVIVRAPD
jgi:uncharacterized protein YcfL